MCDCEIPQAMREEWRTARKPHRCCECSAWITPRERYHYISGIWDHQAASFHTCVQCVQVRDWISANHSAWDCEPCFGGLYDDMLRADWPPHMVAAQDALRAERRAA